MAKGANFPAQPSLLLQHKKGEESEHSHKRFTSPPLKSGCQSPSSLLQFHISASVRKEGTGSWGILTLLYSQAQRHPDLLQAQAFPRTHMSITRPKPNICISKVDSMQEAAKHREHQQASIHSCMHTHIHTLPHSCAPTHNLHFSSHISQVSNQAGS